MTEKSNYLPLKISDGAVTWIWVGNKWLILSLCQEPALFARRRCEADEAVQQQARVGGAGGRGGQRHRAGGDDKVTAGHVSRHVATPAYGHVSCYTCLTTPGTRPTAWVTWCSRSCRGRPRRWAWGRSAAPWRASRRPAISTAPSPAPSSGIIHRSGTSTHKWNKWIFYKWLYNIINIGRSRTNLV